MGFWIGLAAGLVIGATAGSGGIAAAMGLHRAAIEEIKAHCLELAQEVGEPTPQAQRRKTLS